MSRTHHLVCHDKKKHIWIGQGVNAKGQMAAFYSGEPRTMLCLGEFFRQTQGHDLRLVDSEEVPDGYTDMTPYDAD